METAHGKKVIVEHATCKERTGFQHSQAGASVTWKHFFSAQKSPL